MDKQVDSYRIRATYRQWIGKPDPSGFGVFFVESRDPSWIHEHAVKLERRGHKVRAVEKYIAGSWVRI